MNRGIPVQRQPPAGRPGRGPYAGARARSRPGVRPAPWRDVFRLPRDPFRLALFALTVVTVSRVHQALGLGALRPALLLFLFALGYVVLNPKVLRTDLLFRTWPPKVFIGLGIMACLSVPFGISMGGSAMFIISTYSKVLLFGLFLVAAIRRSGDLRLFVGAYVISCGILVWFAAFVFSVSQFGGISRLGGLYTYDSNDLGLVLMVGLPLSIMTMQTATDAKTKWLSAAIIAGIGVAIALSGSRGGFLGLLCVGLALLFALKQISIVKRLGFVLAVGLSLAIAAPQGYWEQMQTIMNPTADYNWESNYGRRQVWTRGMGYFASNPITGIGVGNFGRAEGTLSDVAQNFQNRTGERLKWSVAHNSFLEPLAEMGLPGFILWSSLVIGGFVSMVRLRRKLPQGWARGDPEQRFLYAATVYLPVSFIGFASTAFFVSFTYQDPIYILAALVAGVHVSVRDRLRRETWAASAARGEAAPRASNLRRPTGDARAPALSPVPRSPRA